MAVSSKPIPDRVYQPLRIGLGSYSYSPLPCTQVTSRRRLCFDVTLLEICEPLVADETSQEKNRPVQLPNKSEDGRTTRGRVRRNESIFAGGEILN
jgi:hypothetical protein